MMNSSKIVISDTSVLINFLKVNSSHLLKALPDKFLITDYVKAEITNSYPEQLTQFEKDLKEGLFEEVAVRESQEMEIFSTLIRQGLGIGECSAIAMAIEHDYKLAIDDKRAIKLAYHLAPHLQILKTQDLVVSLIQNDILEIHEADALLHLWSTQHRFKLKIHSFNELDLENRDQF